MTEAAEKTEMEATDSGSVQANRNALTLRCSSSQPRPQKPEFWPEPPSPALHAVGID